MIFIWSHFVKRIYIYSFKIESLPIYFLGQENIAILHWNKETFSDESLNRQQLVEVNQAGNRLFPNLS